MIAQTRLLLSRSSRGKSSSQRKPLLNGNQKGMMTNYRFPKNPEIVAMTRCLVEVCQMWHRKLPLLMSPFRLKSFPPEWMPLIIIGIFRLPCTKIYARQETIFTSGRKLGEWKRAEIRFSVVCARWRMKISDELWINPLIAFLSSADSQTVDCSSPFFSSPAHVTFDCCFEPVLIRKRVTLLSQLCSRTDNSFVIDKITREITFLFIKL